MKPLVLPAVALLIFAAAIHVRADAKVTSERNANDDASPTFKFKNIPAPSKTHAGGPAKFTLVDGTRDRNGGSLDVLHDGKLPREGDQPAASFFFAQGEEGGRIVLDLGSVTEVKQINTYSWHPDTRGPQVYKLWASDGKAADFSAEAKKGADLEKTGWTQVASVDTRPKEGDFGGQYGVSVANNKGPLGSYRYFLFDISRTEDKDPFGNTFYSEIDIIDSKEHVVATASEPPKEKIEKTFEAEGGTYQITINATAAPDLADWAFTQLAPVTTNWYPKLVKMLPSDGFEAPKHVTITFRETMRVPAATGGAAVSCNAAWIRQNLKGESKGAIVHELVHVVQQYGYGRKNSPNATRTPVWLVEGIPDYLRWYLYEPETHGADISKRRLAAAKYDASYRVTGNFLNWVTEKYSPTMVVALNAAARQGKYTEEIWKEKTGKSLSDLGDEWKKALEVKLAAASPAEAGAGAGTRHNALSEAEKQAGWKLLFDGKDMEGWHNFKKQDIRPGWQVTNGTLACVDPHNAGDIVTTEQFDWFELQLDYNISEGGNSGIMFRVSDKGGAAWASGPEFQLEDNKKAGDPQRCGWLYALYQPPVDPKTEKPLDATKPAGEWNHVRLLISQEKCEHEINGVKYFDYVLGSDDFNERVAKSKFAKMPLFAKSPTGSIALQGDHGQVSFRDIKVRPLK